MKNTHTPRTSTFVRFILLIVFAAVLATSASAITVDNRASQGVFNSTPTINALNWTHTVNSCTNCVVYIAIVTYSTTTSVVPVISVTYTDSSGSRTVTTVGSQASPLQPASPLGQSTIQLYRVVDPAVGNGAIAVTSSATVNYLFGSSVSFNAVSQTTPDNGWSSATGTNNTPFLNVLGGARGSVILDVLGSTPQALFMAPTTAEIVCTDIAIETTCTRGRQYFGGTFDIGALGYYGTNVTTNTSSWQLSVADAWALGGVAINPSGTTAGDVSVQGQLLSADGRAVGGANVYAQDSKGVILTAVSNPFGYFTFDEMTAGETYVFSVLSKGNVFQPKAITVNESLSGIQIIALSPDPPSSRDGSAAQVNRPR